MLDPNTLKNIQIDTRTALELSKMLKGGMDTRGGGALGNNDPYNSRPTHHSYK